MLEFLPTSDDVIALRIAHRITGEELEAIMDRLEPMLEKHDKVHVFVETQSIDGIEIAGLHRYSARALPMLGKLAKFGRVAVVADQAWIRFWTRVESALLPFISYKTFLPEDGDAALSWVKGHAEFAGR